MTHQEFKTKISEIMDEAIKIDEIEKIANDMDRTLKKEDLNGITKDALVIGYAGMLSRTYSKIRYIWAHLYDLRSKVDDLHDHFLDLPTDDEIAAVREVNGDD